MTLAQTPENSPAGQNIGIEVTANDTDARTLGYRFEGRDASLFDFNPSTGQIRTKRGVTYNHEDPACGYVDTASPTACNYLVTVVAFDRAGGSDAIRVQIEVDDQTERPSAPARPTVQPTANSRRSLDVSWNAPDNTGPPITRYTVEYRRKGSTDDFSSDGVTVTGTSATIAPTDDDLFNGDDRLVPGIAYEVRVRATSGEGTSPSSPLGTGSTNAGNREPVFRDRDDNERIRDAQGDLPSATTAREVDENTQSGRSIGRAVAADDGDGDGRTYKLVAETPGDSASDAAAAKFDINKSTGQILTKEPLNHEDAGCDYDANDNPTCTYTVNVDVRDGLDANRVKEESETATDDTITVTITVNDLSEPPSAPMVTGTSPETVTTLEVHWVAENTGPPITSYDLQYKVGSSYSSDDCQASGVIPGANSCNALAVTNATITGLTVNTLYTVEVLARNDEGTSPRSSISLSTNRNKSANTPNSVPDFTGVDTMLEVNESNRLGLEVGTVSLISDDSDGGTLRYTLEGLNRDLFAIGSSSALITTRRALNHEDPACRLRCSTGRRLEVTEENMHLQR